MVAMVPFDMDKPMGQVRQLDKRMNEAGLLRLMVDKPAALKWDELYQKLHMTKSTFAAVESLRLEQTIAI